MSKLIIEPSPHIKSGVTTQKIMLCVIIALCPALIASVWIFGLRALLMTVICCTSCVIFEWVCRKIMKRSNTISDLSAVVTGMLLAFNLPVTLPFYMAVIGCFVAIVIVKQLFGGIGKAFQKSQQRIPGLPGAENGFGKTDAAVSFDVKTDVVGHVSA